MESKYYIQRIEFEFGKLVVYVEDSETGFRNLYEITANDNGDLSIENVVNNFKL